MSTETQQFELWIQQWEDAQKGVMKPTEQPVQKTKVDNYFGFQNEKPEDVEIGQDSEEMNTWKVLADMAAPTSERGQLLTEQGKSDKIAVADAAKRIAQSANPIRAGSVGKDQDLNPQSLGNTYSQQDVEELAEMKVKLHTLQDQLNSFEGRGQNGKKFESQIETLKQKIDELSDAMTTGFPLAISPQGD
jgi:hypothetical protein